jgi:hypothetical protein
MKKYITPAVWVTALALTAVVLLVYEYHWLWKIQEQSLFLDTSLFFRQLMVVPGGLLSYIGSFLTQLLYYPILGVAVLCLLWGLLMWMMQRTFKVSQQWAPLLVVPVAMLLAANVEMGYWIYTIKLRGWFFDATIGVMVIIALLWVFRLLSAYRMWRRVLLVLTTIVGYPLFGTYALAATVLMALWCWRLDKDRWQALADTILGLLTVAAMPLFYYQYVYYQTNIVNLWWTALPIFKILETYNEYYVPYALLAVCLVILTIGKWNQDNKTNQANVPNQAQKTHKPNRANKAQKAKNPRKLKITWQTLVVTGVLAVTVYGVWKMWMKDENFHHEVTMMHYAEQTRWEEVLEEAAKQQDIPTRAIVMMRNLALSRLGRQGSEMYKYLGGSKKPDSPFAPPASLIVGDMIYYNYGMMNDCHHMCIEGGVEFGWRVQHLKYLARCGLMTGETNAMYKHTEILKHTLFHGEWARHLEELQQQPKLMRTDKETGPVTHMLHYPDIVGSDHGYAERYLMNHLAVMDSDDPYFQEQCLLAAMWTKDSKLFWARFSKYLSQHPGQPVPRYYKEAAYLFSYLEENSPFQVQVDEGMKRTFDAFAKMLEQHDGSDIEDARKALYPLYGDTYYYEFFLMEDTKYL